MCARVFVSMSVCLLAVVATCLSLFLFCWLSVCESVCSSKPVTCACLSVRAADQLGVADPGAVERLERAAAAPGATGGDQQEAAGEEQRKAGAAAAVVAIAAAVD